MADKPSRGLVLYGDGLMRFVSPSHTHLHCLASKASCGFLSLSHSPPSESKDERIVREFSQLLDACESCLNESGKDSVKSECQEKSSTPTIADRFMGMRSAVITNNRGLQSSGSKFGLTILQLNELVKNNHPLTESPPDVVVSELLKLLGLNEGHMSETSQFDLIFMHTGTGEEVANNVDYVNDLVGKILNKALPGSEIGSRLHFSVVMSYGDVSENDDQSLSILMTEYEKNSDISILIPRQSYTMKGTNQRKNVRHYCPMLSAQWQDAVTRKDMAETFSFKDFKEHGGNLTIPADRFLHEVAFKLWKAPKYGA